MRGWPILLLAVLLCGCFDDQKQQVAACQLEAIHTYPTQQLYVGGDVEHYIRTCMTAHGYDFNLFDKRCEVTNTLSANPYCYIPASTIGRWIYSMETGSK
jgi:hypothetical protein